MVMKAEIRAIEGGLVTGATASTRCRHHWLRARLSPVPLTLYAPWVSHALRRLLRAHAQIVTALRRSWPRMQRLLYGFPCEPASCSYVYRLDAAACRCTSICFTGHLNLLRCKPCKAREQPIQKTTTVSDDPDAIGPQAWRGSDVPGITRDVLGAIIPRAPENDAILWVGSHSTSEARNGRHVTRALGWPEYLVS
jgi:non-ribosomal peptide synthetase component F